MAYGPTTEHTTLARATIASSDAGSWLSAVTMGMSVAFEPSLDCTDSSLAWLRPPIAHRRSPPLPERAAVWCATRRPVEPVAPQTMMLNSLSCTTSCPFSLPSFRRPGCVPNPQDCLM